MSTDASGSIGASSSGTPSQASLQNAKNSFSKLESAVNSGDMSTASTVLTQIKNSAPRNPGAGSTSTTIQQDFASLDSAISAKDATKAQAALQQLQSDMAAMKKAHQPKPSSSDSSTSNAGAQAVTSSDSDSDSDKDSGSGSTSTKVTSSSKLDASA